MSRTPSRFETVILFLALGAVAGCKRSAPGLPGGDGGVQDAAKECEEPALELAFELATELQPEYLPDEVERYTFQGTLVYHGKVREPPPPGAPMDREIEVADDSASQRVVFRYHLPNGLRLPVRVGGRYVFQYRVRQAMGPIGAGLLITESASGSSSALFLGETGPERTFLEGSNFTFPIRVTVEPRSACDPVPEPSCGGTLFRDQLRFEPVDAPSSGMVLVQGQQDTLTAEGRGYTILNASSVHWDQTCPDAPTERVAYLALRAEEMPKECDTSRFYVNDDPDPELGVGDFCSDLTFCASEDAVQIVQMAGYAVDCSGTCPEGGTFCRFDLQGGWIDETIYDELCSVSTMVGAPETILCTRYQM